MQWGGRGVREDGRNSVAFPALITPTARSRIRWSQSALRIPSLPLPPGVLRYRRASIKGRRLLTRFVRIFPSLRGSAGSALGGRNTCVAGARRRRLVTTPTFRSILRSLPQRRPSQYAAGTTKRTSSLSASVLLKEGTRKTLSHSKTHCSTKSERRNPLENIGEGTQATPATAASSLATQIGGDGIRVRSCWCFRKEGMECYEDPENPGQVYVRLLRQDLLEELVMSKKRGRLVVILVDDEFLVYRPTNGVKMTSPPNVELLVKDVCKVLGRDRWNAAIKNHATKDTSVHIFTDMDLYELSDLLAKELDVRVFCHLFHRIR
ncbi:hypothetical protein HPB51_015841 [Rhipicephalus microplus]|uniref:Uncharacterized protein n=2 Tax=Rhipicephalus microplus TaxID=6941 RepID=A0A9J6DH29_RHIMP|nr:hypothetical protein HPB51_015841 [Rhipicephalus microplus]